ncbi:MAG: polyphenol oxidase family protein [Acidimicrobiales bacterium]
MPAPPVPAGAAAWALRDAGGAEVLGCPELEGLGLDLAVTTRSGGVSVGPYRSLNLGLHVGDDPLAVVENRRRAAAVLGATLDDLVLGAQVHGSAAAVVGDADRGRGARSLVDAVDGADILVTDRPGPVLAVLVADCAPIVLFDPAAGVVATVHAGWRGTAAGAVPSALRAMAGLGARPEQTVAGIGPAIPAPAYQVGPEVAAGFRRRLGQSAGGVLAGDGPGRWRCDLVSANRLLLERAGIRPENVHVAAAATGPDGPFFSDRAARPCGRFALLARLRP